MQTRVKENVNEIGRCGCGRSPTGKCIGWHGLEEGEFREKLAEWELTDLNKRLEEAKELK
jgi:hypothetical protein